MEFELSESQKNIIATFRAFGEEVFTSDHVFQWRRDQGLPDEVVKGFVDRYFALDKVQSDGRRGLDIMGQTSSWKNFQDALALLCRFKTTCSIYRY